MVMDKNGGFGQLIFVSMFFQIFAPATQEMVKITKVWRKFLGCIKRQTNNYPLKLNDVLCFFGLHELLGMIISYWIFRAILRIVLNIQNRVLSVPLTNNTNFM